MSSTASSTKPSIRRVEGDTWLGEIRTQIVRRRITASIVIFAAVIAADVFLLGILPRDVFNLADPFVVLGLLSLVAGLAIRSWSAGVLHKHKRLTMTGPYSLVRNPLYFGSFLMMFGFGLLIDDWWSAPILVAVLVVIYMVQILHEEKSLRAQFHQEWDHYAASTPRLIPHLRRPTPSDWSVKQWRHNREWEAIAASCIAIVALKAWLVLFG